MATYLHPNHSNEVFSNPSDFHPFARTFLKAYSDAVIRNEYMGGLGTVPVLEYITLDGESWFIPLRWDPQFRWYELAQRHPHDNTQLIPCDMETLQRDYPIFYAMSQTMYSTAR